MNRGKWEVFEGRRRRVGPGRITLAPDDPRHGTTNGYSNLGCRCEPCREAHRVNHNAYMHRSGQIALRSARARGKPLPYDVDAIDAAISSRTPGTAPRTLAEWQYAADLAELALSLDAAKQFGLIEGGPVVNCDACADLIEAAAERWHRTRSSSVAAVALRF